MYIPILLLVCERMKDGVFTLFGTHEVQALEVMKSYTKAFRMPYVTPSLAANSSGQEYGYELYLRPLYSRALLDIINYYDWKLITYVFQTQEGVDKKCWL